jgi:hypothetical protein
MNKQFLNVAVHGLSNEQHPALNEALQHILRRYNFRGTILEILSEKHAQALTDEKTVLNIMTASFLTGDIHGQDRRRDRTYRGFVLAILSGTYHFDPNKEKAADRLEKVVDHYGNIAAKNLNAETEAICDLLTELVLPDNAAAIATLNLEEWLLQLKADNDTFRSLVYSRYDEKAQLPLIRMKEARVETDKYYRLILDQVETFLVVDSENPVYTQLVRDINPLLERYKTMLAQQAGVREKKKEKEKEAKKEEEAKTDEVKADDNKTDDNKKEDK